MEGLLVVRQSGEMVSVRLKLGKPGFDVDTVVNERVLAGMPDVSCPKVRLVLANNILIWFEEVLRPLLEDPGALVRNLAQCLLRFARRSLHADAIDIIFASCAYALDMVSLVVHHLQRSDLGLVVDVHVPA